MSIEILTAALLPGAGGQRSDAAMERTISLGPSGAAQGAQGAEASKFAEALGKVAGAAGVERADMPAPVGNMLRALDGIDVQARSVTDFAQSAQASNGELTPGEIVQLTMKCQEFMFQCQLTSNIANRSADGLQQLFRQQG